MTRPVPEPRSTAGEATPAVAGISVVLPAHNEERNIRPQVESVLGVFGLITPTWR